MRRYRRKPRSVAVQAFELGIAVPQVIAHRVARMANAGAFPSVHDRAEFHRMGVEKIAAANEAWAAMVGQAFLENQKLALAFMQSLWVPWTILGKGMTPVRRRAVANARRLRRKA